ncbi:MAG: NADH:ubiquinone oxidoreductase subunit NDUFA12 [Alphaproteobacteria bacterium]
MSLSTRLFTLLHGHLVGTDEEGNRYYEQRGAGALSHPDLGPSKQRRQRRWVLYKGEVEASRIPPEWHAWLHYTVESPPDPEVVAKRRRFWQKKHQPNTTGTPAAYLPPGHSLAGGRRRKATGDYDAWIPPK